LHGLTHDSDWNISLANTRKDKSLYQFISVKN
jgi:hypothetical protein